MSKFDMYQDVHTESWFAFLATTRLFGIMLDWLVAVFMIIVSFGSVVSKDCKFPFKLWTFSGVKLIYLNVFILPCSYLFGGWGGGGSGCPPNVNTSEKPLDVCRVGLFCI